MNEQIKRGDLVRLKSGGPTMTVGEVVTAEMVEKDKAENDGETVLTEGEATCAWFSARPCANSEVAPIWGDANSGTFHVDMLTKAL